MCTYNRKIYKNNKNNTKINKYINNINKYIRDKDKNWRIHHEGAQSSFWQQVKPSSSLFLTRKVLVGSECNVEMRT